MEDGPHEIPIEDVLDLHPFRAAEVRDVALEYLMAARAHSVDAAQARLGGRIHRRGSDGWGMGGHGGFAPPARKRMKNSEFRMKNWELAFFHSSFLILHSEF